MFPEPNDPEQWQRRRQASRAEAFFEKTVILGPKAR
jgi:hypothetical protein